MPVLTLLSPAKINLFLHITGKRADGYHNLQTVFRLIDFYDEMQFSVIDNEVKTHQTHVGYTAPLSLFTNSLITQSPSDNLVIKAGQALYDFAKREALLSSKKLADLPFIEIALKKCIPMGAGLGGGSSNCAMTLLALNYLWDLGLNTAQLQVIGTKLGADVPIFILGQDAIAEGIGEILTPIQLPPQRFLLLTPTAHINTTEIFTHPKLYRDSAKLSNDYLISHEANFIDALSPEFSNVFEPVVRALSLEVTTALDYLHDLENTSHSVARMSGSGSSVYLPLPSHLPYSIINEWQNKAPCPAVIVHTLPNRFLSSCFSENCA